ENVRLNKIHFHPIESEQTEERAFRSGQLHVTNSVPTQKIEHYKENEPEALRIDPYLGTYYYLLNIDRLPLDNILVRKALSMAIDRKAIVENVLKGGQLPAYHFTPPNTAGYTSQNQVESNPEMARKLLAEAGYPNGEGFPAIEILYNTLESHQLIAQAIQEMWKKELNIGVSLINQEWKVFLNTQKEKTFDISRAGWIGDYNDPNTFLDMWISGGGNNHTGFANAAYDSLIKEASLADDTDSRFSYFQQAETILMEQVPVIPIYFYTSLSLIHPSVKGWHPTILDHHPYKAVYLEE
ncbi:MAG: peptide ABC transporter substrate-binding protein, partial [Chitinivibrionales bacterium]|nr:peptide ABC transporter substrate-binding protein [Chitinivibrionales bacterium]